MPKYDVEVYARVLPYVYEGDLGIEADTAKEAREIAIQDFIDDLDEDLRHIGYHMFKFTVKVKKQEDDI